MCKKELKANKSGKDLVDYAIIKGADIDRINGSHVIVKTPHGMCVVPVHGNQQLGKGIWCKVIKTFIAIGLGGFVLIYVMQYL